MTGLNEMLELNDQLETEVKSLMKERDQLKEALASLTTFVTLDDGVALMHEMDSEDCDHTVKFYNDVIYPIKIELGMDVQKVEE